MKNVQGMPTREQFDLRLSELVHDHNELIQKTNKRVRQNNGQYHRYELPILTAAHTPLFWRYDLNYNDNPYLMERLGVNAVLNAGAIKLDDKYLLITRTEGSDRKSFFAVAESPNGIDQFEFWDYPIDMPPYRENETNIYDMRVVQHQDGWIYGLFCTESKDLRAPAHDTSSAIAQCGIARTKDLKKWQRMPDLLTTSGQQRNVVLHPEFVEGKYAFYTRPQDGFIDAGSGGGIGWGLVSDIENPIIPEQLVIEPRTYHTIKEAKNGLGPAPIKTEKGWLHLAHGVRNTAAGLRYVLYLFMTDLGDPSKITYSPGGYFLAPEGEERIGDVSNVLFANGWIMDDNGDVFIYYASSDTRMHVATTTINQLLDYVTNTPVDELSSYKSVEQRSTLIEKNLKIFNKKTGNCTNGVAGEHSVYQN